MAKPDKLAAEIEAAEEKIFRNPDGDEIKAPSAPVSASEKAVAEVNAEVISPPEKEPTKTEVVADVKPEEGVAKPDEDYEKRFKNFKPMADATINGLRREVLALQQESQDLRKQMGDMVAKLTEANATPEASIETMFTEEERNLIGDETLKAMEKFKQQIVETKVAPLETRETTEG